MSTALGCLLISLLAPVQESNNQLATPHITEQQYRQHVEFLASDDLEGRKVDSQGLIRASEYIIKHWEKLAIRPGIKDQYVQAFFWDGKHGTVRGAIDRPDATASSNEGRLTVRNLVGMIPGKGGLADEAVIVCAHHDHLGRVRHDDSDNTDDIYNGADDNASGVALLLMLAAQLDADLDQLPDSHRTVILIAFDAEEHGLVGSRYYVQNPIWPLEKTAVVLNYDMVGRPLAKSLLCLDAESCPKLAPIISNLARQYGLLAETRLSGLGRSDNAPFLRHQVPAIHFTSGSHVDYHQVTDEADRLNYADATRVARHGYHVLRTALVHQGRFEYQTPNPLFDIPALLQIAAKLGIVPKENAQNGKYPEILFVIPNSPAAKAGIKAGDQLVAINGAPIDRIQDALTMFSQLNLRADLRLTMLRQRKNVDISLSADALAGILGPIPEKLPNGKYKVVFRYVGNQETQSVHLAGSFNDWDKNSLPMTGPDQKGVFQREMVLDEGVYEYKFIVNQTQWKPDPENAHRIGQYQNSVLKVGND